ncbi:MAG: thioredoxin domain-containing protein [Cytophagales bacterium]|nr:thioredoxin domain-containing protein [Cytophagales bacterium]
MKPLIQSTDQTLGSSKGLIQVICYGDYLDPGSREMHFTMSQLLSAFAGKLRYAFRPFPQPLRHPCALLVARAVEAAGRQGYYWPMHYALFRYRGNIDLDRLYDLACALGLDLEAFHRDLEDQALSGQLLAAVEAGRGYGVEAAPALFFNGERQYTTALWHLQELLERQLTALQRRRVAGTVNPRVGTVFRGHWPEL